MNECWFNLFETIYGHTFSGKHSCGFLRERFGGCFDVGWVVNIVISNRYPESTWDLDDNTWAISRHALSVMTFFYVWVCGHCALPSFSFRAIFFFSQQKTLKGLCGFENVSQASTSVAKSGWTVPLNKSPAHKRQQSLMMFDVSAHWISLYLEMQSQEVMNPLKRTPGEVLLFFLSSSPSVKITLSLHFTAHGVYKTRRLP